MMELIQLNKKWLDYTKYWKNEVQDFEKIELSIFLKLFFWEN